MLSPRLDLDTMLKHDTTTYYEDGIV